MKTQWVNSMKLISKLLLIGLLFFLPSATIKAEQPELTEVELKAIEESLQAGEAYHSQSQDVQTNKGIVQGLSIQSMNPDISLILDVAYADFSAEDPMQLGAHDPNSSGFNLQQLEMSIGANVDPYFRFDANLVYSQFGVETEEAYATTLNMPRNLQMRAGQFLTRFGRINATHPHSWHFVDQVLVNGKFFGGEGSRGLGAEISWLTPLDWYAEFIVSATQADGECCARSYYGAEDKGVDDLLDQVWTGALKQFFELTPSWALMWGMSGQMGPNPTGPDNRTDIVGSDLKLRYKPIASSKRESFTIQIEYLHRRRQVPFDRLQDQGAYFQAVWGIDAHWETGIRHEWVGGVQEDPLDSEWSEKRSRNTAQVTWYPSHFSRLRLQYSVDDPQWRDEGAITAWMLALEVLAGSHGAHKY